MPTTFNEAIPLFFHLASNGFPDTMYGLVGRIEKKKHKKEFTRSHGGPGTPG